MSKRPTVLVVDDEVDICQNLADILADQDYDVDIAENGAAALALAAAKPYDVALLDLRMPGMDGLSLYRQLRKVRPEVVAIIVTAYASDGTMREAIGSGAWQVLPKPVDLLRLLTLVGDAVRQPLVLVVDDDMALCDNLWELFRDWNLRVCVANTKEEALGRVRDREYEVVLVDLKLPGGDGRDIIESIRTLQPDSHSILITAYAESLLEPDGGPPRTPPDAICKKPFDLQMLRQTLARFLRQHRAEA